MWISELNGFGKYLRSYKKQTLNYENENYEATPMFGQNV